MENQDIIQSIVQYLDIDEVYKMKRILRKKVNIDIRRYLRSVKCPTREEKSYLKYEMCTFGTDDVEWACWAGYLDVVKYLDEEGKQCTEEAIDLASENGHIDVVKYLVEKGKQCTTKAIDWASMNGYIDVVKYLVEKGKQCTSDAIDRVHSWTLQTV